MKGKKIILYTICALVAIGAAVMAIIIFRNEIARFFVDIKDKIEEKRFHSNAEYADYAD